MATDKANMFKKAKAEGTEPVKKNGKTISHPEFKPTDAKIKAKVAKLKVLRATKKTTDAEIKMIEGDIQPVIRQHFLEEFLKTKVRPESFYVVGDEGAKALVTSADAYGAVTKELAADLRKKYGKDIVTETDTYVMDSALVEKHGEALSKAIHAIKGISDDDKDALIKVVTSYAITPGTIDKLATFKDPKAVFEDIRPTVQMKFTQA
jgi:hypothetical protein